MAKKDNAPETVQLVDSRGVTVSVAADKAETRLATGYVKPGSAAAKAAAKTDAK